MEEGSSNIPSALLFPVNGECGMQVRVLNRLMAAVMVVCTATAAQLSNGSPSFNLPVSDCDLFLRMQRQQHSPDRTIRVRVITMMPNEVRQPNGQRVMDGRRRFTRSGNWHDVQSIYIAGNGCEKKHPPAVVSFILKFEADKKGQRSQEKTLSKQDISAE